jgi:hypothetical protein
MIQLKVNGVEQSFGGELEMPLLWYLRDVLELTGSKFGCGVGLCGAYTVHVNGQATRSCVTTMANAARKEVTTVEGLDGNQCAAMWLLPGRADHAGGGFAGQQKETDRSRNRRGDVRKHLPLRDVSANSRGDQGRGGGNGMSAIENVSRRRFLTGGVIAAGALVLGVRYYPKLLPGEKLPEETNADHAALHPSVYLGIDPDGTVWIVASRSEMGTTSRTTLPLVVADELDADWKRVKIEQAIGDKRYGDQNTDGSHSVRSYYDAMREAGATAQFMLIQAAAHQWGVPADDREALRVAGVRQTVPIDPFQPPPAFQPLGGIAFIADNTWAAFQARKKLNVSWDNGPNETYNSDSYKNEFASDFAQSLQSGAQYW